MEISKSKQIEEIKRILNKENGYDYASRYYEPDAEALYNAGYRKASDVAEEIFAEISKASADWGCYCISAFKWGYVTSDVSRTLAELKKKYTEEGK